MIRRLRRLFAVAPLAFACGPFADPMAAESGKPECGSTQLAKLTAGYAYDLHVVCGKTPIKECAEIAKKPVQDKWFPLFDKWAEECD